MTFWLVTGLIALSVFALILAAAMRARAVSEVPAAYDMRVYRDQLKEIERDVARGVLSAQDAERVKVEVSRRILAADTALQAETDAQKRGGLGLPALGALALISLAGTFFLYLQLGAPGYGDLSLESRIALAEARYADRPSQAQAEAALPPAVPQEAPEYLELVKQLRVALQERPDDVRGHTLLARSEARLGNFAAARVAQERVIALLGGEQAPLEEWINLLDVHVLAAGGYVSPEAEAAMNHILSIEPQNGVARYYWGLIQLQVGRPDRAFRAWDALVRQGPPNAPWLPPILAQIEDTAALAGVRYQIPAIGGGRGPSQDDMIAAEDMSPADRMQMIEGMVSGLASRLAEEGGPPRDWAQLMTSLVVLGRVEQAFAVFEEAKSVFDADPAAMDIINRAADQAGLL